MYIDVLVELKVKKIDQTYTYFVPNNLISKIEIGKRVLVPFNNQKLEGFILNIKNEVNFKTKEIIAVIDENPVLNSELIELGNYISKKTISNKITAYQTMLPIALKAKKNTVINKKYISYLKLINKEYVTKTCKQKEILSLFLENELVLKNKCREISLSSTDTLIKNKVLEEVKKEDYRLKNSVEQEKNTIILNEEQNKVIKQINYNKFMPYLIHGVTGSGKTEIYMTLIENVLKEKKEAIVLVPEISLTPQLVNVFKKRFGDDVAILHSGLSDGEKYDEWRKVEKKEVSIVIGARSAIFAPFTNIGIIIIDEEHSATYKQENNPRYNAIDIALYRGKKYNIPVILGSATPSIESYTRSLQKIYVLCELKNRVNDNYPKTILIDMKDEIKKGNSIISKLLDKEIKNRLAKKEQIIILLNRRGYTTVTTCKNCGFTDICPHCDIPLTYHKSSNMMSCHYCGYSHKIIDICPTCQSKNINSFGMGTEKLESILKEKYNARIIRMDQDTTSNKGSHEKIINEFKNHNYDILIGTQMISKGLDFHNVTLVGVINGDASLNIPDFRSAERTFQLLNQVAGRSGRGSKLGEVIIQGFNVDHYSIIAASKNDYIGFYNKELAIRKVLKYSPYYNLCLIKIKSKNYNEVNIESKKIKEHLTSKNLDNVIVLGPTPSMLPKVNDIYNMQIIIKYKNTEILIKELEFINNYYKTSKVNVEIDINPIKM